MIQIAILAVCIGLVVVGIKGFTKSGLPLSRNRTLRGNTARIVGTICILLGVGFIPLCILLFILFAPGR